MIQYLALIDGEERAYGVSFPDLPGIVAMGATRDEALRQAEQALRDYAFETERDGEVSDPPSAFDQIEFILQHLPAGNNREELQHEIGTLQSQPTDHARSMREEVHRNQAGIAPGAQAAKSNLSGRKNGVFDVITAIDNTLRIAVMDRTRHGG